MAASSSSNFSSLPSPGSHNLWRRSSSSSSLAFNACFPISGRNLSIAPSSARFISVLSISPRTAVKPRGIFALDPDFYKIPYVEGVPVGKRLKIWNLPPNTDPQEFRAWFDGLEGVSVESVEFTDDPELNAQNIGGFIEFGTKQEACMAIVRRDGYKFKGRCVRMDFVEKKPHEREIGGRRNRPTYRNNNRMGSSGSYGGGSTSPLFGSRNAGTGTPAPGSLAGSTPATTAAGSPVPPFNNNSNFSTAMPGYGAATAGYNSPPSSVSSGYNSPPSSVSSAYRPNTSGGTPNTGYGRTPPVSGDTAATGYGNFPPVSGGASATINGGTAAPGYASAPPATGGAAATVNGSSPIPSSAPASAGFGSASSSASGASGTSATGYANAQPVSGSSSNVSGVTGYGSTSMPNVTAYGNAPTTGGGTPATGYGSLIPNTRNYSTSPTSAMSNTGPTLTPNTRTNGPGSIDNLGSASSSGLTSATSPYQATSAQNNIPNQSSPTYAPSYGNTTYGSSQSSPNYGSTQVPSGYAAYGRENQLNDSKRFGSNITFDGSESSDGEYGAPQAPGYGGQPTSAPNYGSSSMQSASTYGNATQFSNNYGQSDSSFSGGNSYANFNAAGTAYSRSGYSQGYGNSGYSTPRPSSSNRVFVGNLPWSTDDMSLQQLFSEYGNVLDARVVKDRETGRSRGFGFVSMSTAEEMSAAIQGLDGRQVDGRAIRANQAESRF